MNRPAPQPAPEKPEKPVETFFLQSDPLTGERFDVPQPEYRKAIPVYDADSGELVEFLAPEGMKPRPLAKQIIAEVAAAHDVTTAELLGPRRFKHLSEARREAMIRIREELGYSFPRIGRIFDRDHTSIIWNVRGGRLGQPSNPIRKTPRRKHPQERAA